MKYVIASLAFACAQLALLQPLQANLLVTDYAPGGSVRSVASDGSWSNIITELNYPVAAASDASGNLYVTIEAGNYVNKYDSSGTYLGYVSGLPSVNGIGVADLLVGADGSVYASAATTVAKLTSFTMGGGSFSTLTSGLTGGATGLAMGADGFLYAATYADKIYKINLSDGSKTTFADLGNVGQTFGIAFGPSSYLYAATGAMGIQKVSPAGSVSTYTASGLSIGIAVDNAGTVYGAAGNWDGIQKYVYVPEYENYAWQPYATGLGQPMYLEWTAAPVPEPGTWAAAAMLLSGAGFAGWRRRKQS